MESTIYFFTGTGNSLKVAKDLAEHLGHCELIPIAKIWQRENLASTAQKVGFAFPLYYSGMPKIVYDFIEKIDLTNAEYFFAIVTSAGDVTELPLQQVNMLLKAKSRAKSLNAGFFVTMPTIILLVLTFIQNNVKKSFLRKRKSRSKTYLKL